jgi:hypothetical protein
MARAFVWLGFVYWGIYVLVAPATNFDAQMCHLARLELAMRGGLFNNAYFTSIFQVMYPWTFDAVHLPFLELGWGYALPSFFCLVGTCYVVFAMMRTQFGPDAAWVALASLLGLTCLVYQGTSTKNDIPILFAGAVWVYARWRWRREGGGNVHLGWMVLAIGFMAGSKTTGVLYGFVLALWMLWEFRRNRRLALRIIMGLCGACILWGSVETYIESARLFGYPLGPPNTIRQLQNRDGVRGGIANLTRHIAGSIYVGPITFHSGSHPRLAEIEKALLGRLSLTNAGASDKYRDQDLILYQSGFEELSGFGPIGTMAMATILYACLCWRPRAAWWRLAMAAFLGLVLTSFTVGFGESAHRYLISWYALGTIATVCALWERETSFRRVLRGIFATVAISSAVAAPLLSFNRRPADIIASIRDRDRFETCSVPLTGKVRERLRSLRAEKPNCLIFFVVCNESLVLPFLEDKNLDVILVIPPVFLSLLKNGQVRVGDIVIEDYKVDSPFLTKIEDVTAPNIFSVNGTRTQGIYQVSASPGHLFDPAR